MPSTPHKYTTAQYSLAHLLILVAGFSVTLAVARSLCYRWFESRNGQNAVVFNLTWLANAAGLIVLQRLHVRPSVLIVLSILTAALLLLDGMYWSPALRSWLR